MQKSITLRQFQEQQKSMDLAWLWLIIPSSYIVISLIFLCFPFFHKNKYTHSVLAALSSSEKILCIGHRGGGFEGPENTLQLFKKTDQISHMFELDVCETKDHHLVVHHDTNLSRTTGKNDSVNDYNLHQMPTFQKEIDAFGAVQRLVIKTEENKIPTLDELFKIYPKKLMNIDLKTPTETAITEFGRLVRLHQRQDCTIWGSMGNKGCTELRQSYQEVPSFYSGWQIFKIFLLCISGLLPFWPLRHGVLDIPLYTDPMGDLFYRFAGTSCRKILVCIVLQLLKFFNLVSRLFIPHLKKRGIPTFYWIVNQKEGWEKAISMGCQGIMTDCPSELSAFLKEKNLYFYENQE